MRVAPALVMLLLAAPALAQTPETYDCRATQFCALPGQCQPASDTTPVLEVTISADGEIAAMQSGPVALDFRRRSDIGTARVFLLERPDGVGLFTLEADLNFAVASHEIVASGLAVTSGTGQCVRRGG